MTQRIQPEKLSVITTLGPATSDPQIIRDLLPLSSQFRLNSSHLSPDELRDWLSKLHLIFKEANTAIPVVIDLQGAKMRIGKIDAVDQLPENIVLVEGKSSHNGIDINSENSNPVSHKEHLITVSDREYVLPIPHSRFFEHVQRGEELLLNDGKVAIRITDRIARGSTNTTGCPTKPDIQLKARVISNGPLSSRKGINRKNHPVPFDSISEKDKEIIDILNEFDFTQIAISFIVDGSEIDLVRKLSSKKIASKIERPESFPHLETIASKSDEVWLCRGDLGAQAGLWEMAFLQTEFEEFLENYLNLNIDRNDEISTKKTDFFLAGQVFEHLTHAKEATRSEVSHFYNSSCKGYKGIVLSDETAIGSNPVRALSYIRNLQMQPE